MFITNNIGAFMTYKLFYFFFRFSGNRFHSLGIWKPVSSYRIFETGFNRKNIYNDSH